MLFAACGMSAAVFLAYYGGFAAASAGAVVLAMVLLAFRKPELLPELMNGSRDAGKRRAAALLVLLFYCLGAVSMWHTDRQLEKEASLLKGSTIRGAVTDCARKVDAGGESRLQLTVQSEQGKVLASYRDTYDDECAPEGRIVELRGEITDPAVKRNPGCFDYALYLRSRGITKTMTCDSITVQPLRPLRQAPLAYLRNRVCTARDSFIARLEHRTDFSTAAMMRAIMFGDKGGLEEDTLERFQQNGTAHILAVSGLHIGIIFAFLRRLWRWRRGRGYFVFNLAFFVMYAAAAGFSPSVTRAVVMVLLHILAELRGWRYDLSSGAFAVMIGVLLHQPYMLFNTGFEMSFLAVLTLVLVLPYLKRFYSGILLASLAVQLGLGPFMLYQFNYLSLLSVLINVPIVFLAGLIVPAGLVSMACGAAGLPGTEYADRLIRILCRILEDLNTAGQAGGMTTLQIPSPLLQIIGMYYLGLLLLASEEGRLALIRAAAKGRYAVKMILLIVMLSTAFQAFASDGFSKCDMTFVDVGQGDCMHLRVKDSSRLFRKEDAYHVLIDGGGRDQFDVGKKILRPYLLKNGVGKIDLAIVTHLHNDHYDGIRSLCREGMVEKLCIYEGYKVNEAAILEECGIAREDLIYAAAGDVLRLGDASFQMLAPPAKSYGEYIRLAEDETDENKKSLLIRVEYHGVSAMMTGDIGEDGEKDAWQRSGASALRCDILKVGHHGSKTSSSDGFLDAVRPSVSVIQVGENNRYGHPAQETLEKLDSRRIPVYRNDLQGAVGLEFGKGRIRKIRTMISANTNNTIQSAAHL